MKVLSITRKISTSQIIIFSFLIVILIGTGFLMLPISTVSKIKTPFSEALFTATSAVCVTGLVVRDTATYWSDFGQVVILCLIQIGGLGVITLALSMAILSGRKIGIRQKQTMQEAVSAKKMGGILRFTGFIVVGTLLIEVIGMIILSTIFVREYGPGSHWGREKSAFFTSPMAVRTEFTQYCSDFLTFLDENQVLHHIRHGCIPRKVSEDNSVFH